jgi:hypothetical protein
LFVNPEKTMKINIRTSVAGLIAAIVALTAADAYATTRTVTSTADGGAGTLRDTIAASAANDTINFSVTGTITLTSGELAIGRNLTIIGPGANVLTVSGNNASRVFDIASSITVNISGLTIANGRVVGANGADGNGGHPDGFPGANAQGGGILNQGALNLTNCTLSSNSAIGGTGGSGSFGGSVGNGGAGGASLGGGILNQGTLTLLNCTLAGNSATGGNAGGFGNESNAGAGGAATGGGIANQGTLTLLNCTLAGNSATGGNGGSTLGINAGAGGGSSGGAIFNQAALTLLNCTLTGNSAGGGTGGAGTDNLANGGNGGNSDGGAIHNEQSLSIASCTLSANTVTGGTGGNGHNSGDGGNGGNAFGGGVFDAGSGSYLNTIVANNAITAGAGGTGSPAGATGSAIGPDVDGPVSSQGHNLISRNNGSTGFTATGDQTGTIASPLNPLLGPLADNGGPTFTIALQPTSAAIDAGDDSVTNSLATDQRGHPRKSGAHVDIGAYEVNPPLSLVVSNTNDSGVSSLRQVIVDVAPGDSITFASSVTGTIALTTGELLMDKNATIIGPTAAGVTVSGNNSTRVFHITAGTVSISGLTIANGNIGGPGAGFFSETGCTLALSNCTVSGNVSGNSGGGIANNGTLTLVNCTVAGNQAGNSGGIYNYAGTLNLFNSTVASNSAVVASGGVYNYPTAGSVTSVRSSIIASNTAPTAPDVDGAFGSSGYNLVGNTSGSSGFGATGDQLNVDPKLGLLADNGGPTLTMALLAGSPAIDKGKSFGLTTDQRGQPRPYDDLGIANASGGDGTDIGAYEIEINAASFRITSIVRQGNNIQVAWITVGGKTNVVQFTKGAAGGSYSNNFADLSPIIVPSGSGLTTTNYTDIGGATNTPARYYRVRLVP